MTTSQRRSRWTGLLASFAAIVAVLLHVTWAPAQPLTGPTPVTANAQMSVTTSTDNVADGTAIHFTVTTSGPDTLNLVEAHICIHGSSTYTLSNFNYSASTALRCVYAPGIDTGGLNSIQPSYKLGPVPFSAVTTSGDQSFTVGSGSVSWFNSGSFGPASMTCGAASECDLVVRVGLTGDPDVTDTFFIQPICFAGGSCGSGTTTTTGGTTSTTGGTTSTTGATTTTHAATTTTQAATTTTKSTTTTSSGDPSTTTTVAAGGTGGTPTTLAPFVSGASSTGSGGSLAFTGSMTRNLASIALLLLAVGLFLLGQASRRRRASTR